MDFKFIREKAILLWICEVTYRLFHCTVDLWLDHDSGGSRVGSDAWACTRGLKSTARCSAKCCERFNPWGSTCVILNTVYTSPVGIKLILSPIQCRQSMRSGHNYSHALDDPKLLMYIKCDPLFHRLTDNFPMIGFQRSKW